MAHLKDIPIRPQTSVRNLECPTFERTNFVAGPTLKNRRIAVVSTAGLHRREDNRFSLGATDFRVIPKDTSPSDILMSHISINYDRTGFLQDINTILPLDRLQELETAGEIGSVSANHYSFMGATDPANMQPAAAQVAGMLKADQVDAVLLVPV
ncbi:MAG: D-proline reductase (dithiol) PrdB [Paracoccaceae bacterium]|jgi:D-proline reductase (dithiol) PrdB